MSETSPAAGGEAREPLFRRLVRRRVPHVLGAYVPRTLVELARIEIARGNARAARPHLDRALEVCSVADPSYEPAAEARALLQTLEVG